MKNVTKITETRTVVGLLRVSTDHQEMDRQQTDLERVKRAHGLDLIRTIPLKDVSGRTVLDNIEVQRMLADLKRPDITGVAVSALDRLFRPERFGDFAILDFFRESGKLIFSAKEGVLDPATDAGFVMSMMSGVQAGVEWRTLKSRTMAGKEERRKRGEHPHGLHTLPRGLTFERTRNADGKVIRSRWAYTEPDSSRIRTAFDLLIQGESYRSIAAKIGGGWSGRSLYRTMSNPCWMGKRVYPADAHREEPIEVSMNIEPLISPARWQAAQKVIRERHSSWTKTNLQGREPRFLGTGLLFCECGRKYYTDHDTRRFQHDTYFCSSALRTGVRCGSHALRRELVDKAIREGLVSYLLDPTFLKMVLGNRKREPKPDTAQQTERELAKLATKRKRTHELYTEGFIEKAEFVERVNAIERAKAELETRLPAPEAAFPTAKELCTGFVRTLGTFEKEPFETQRGILRRVIRSIPVTATGTIEEFTVSGAFLTEFAAHPKTWQQPS
jgi:site-specific DNA recombinase